MIKKYLNIEFHKNPSSESRVIPCGRTDRQTDRQTDRPTKKLVVAFSDFANAPKT